MSEIKGIDVQVSLPFLRRLKDLAKRYRQIQNDIQPVIDELRTGNFLGDRIKGQAIPFSKFEQKIAIFLLAKVVDIV